MRGILGTSLALEHPGESPIAYSSLAGETTKHIAAVTIIETAVVTTYITTTTTVLRPHYTLVITTHLHSHRTSHYTSQH